MMRAGLDLASLGAQGEAALAQGLHRRAAHHERDFGGRIGRKPRGQMAAHGAGAINADFHFNSPGSGDPIFGDDV